MSKISKYKKILFLLLAFCVFGLGPNVHAQETDTYLQGRAVAMANFQTGEIIPTPKFNYIMPGQRNDVSFVDSRTQKVIKIFDPQLSIAGLVIVFEAPVYDVTDGKKHYSISSFKGRVEDILKDAGIELANEDVTEPPRATALAGEGETKIKITRVTLAEIENFESLPYQVKKIEDPNLERGQQKTQQAGKDGKRRLLYRVRREDGVEISRVLIDNQIVEQPQDQIIKIGTKVVVLASAKGYATIYNPSNCSVVSADYKKGDLVRITNIANGVVIFKNVDCTWGSASHASDVVLDLSRSVLAELKYDGSSKGAYVLVEKIKP